MTVNIFTNQTENGYSLAFKPNGFDGSYSRNQRPKINIYGTFDGASVDLQFLQNGGNPANNAHWHSSGDDAITANDSLFFKAPSSRLHRLAITNAGESTDIGAELDYGVLAE